MQRINRLLTVLAIIGSACTFGVSQTPTQPVSPPGKAAGQSSTANTTGTGACIGCQEPVAERVNCQAPQRGGGRRHRQVQAAGRSAMVRRVKPPRSVGRQAAAS